MLYEKVVEIDERVIFEDYVEDLYCNIIKVEVGVGIEEV